MVETTTKNYGWVKPEIQHSPATWGGFINQDLDAIDALVFANQQAISPVGAGALWFTPTPPANWLICDGRSLDTTAYAGLFGVIGYRFGGSGPNFNLPPLANRFPIGASTTDLAATGGEATHVLTVAETPSHAHTITDVAHTHTATQPAHVHPDPGHTHTAGETAAHVHGSNLMRFIGGSGQPLGIVGGGNANVTYGNTDAASSAITVNGALTNLQAAGNDAITVTASGSLIYGTNAAGGGAAHNNMPPWLAINFIIRYQ